MLAIEKHHPLENIPASFSLGLKWFVFYTHIRAEKTAYESISDLGFQAFVPFEKRIVRRPNKKPKEYATALFPRYGFVQFEVNDDRWAEILDAEGVVDVLRSNNIPVAVSNSCIDGLKLADSCGLFDRTKPPEVGMSVEVTSGPFIGWLGKVERARAGDRMDVLLKMFGGAECRATIPLMALREI